MDKRLILQPVFDDKEGVSMGAEVFTRVHTEHRIVSPTELVEAGDDAPYNWRTMDLGALRLLLRSEEERGEEGVLFVNIAEETLSAPAIYHDWLDELAMLVKARQDAGPVMVEIKDNNDLAEPYLGNCIRSIRDAGAGICLDNFGNKFATRSHLFSFDWDYVKCDWRPFNRSDDVWQSIVAASNHCYENGIEGVLLGVEETEDIFRARELGFKLMQGFFFGGEI